MWIYKITNQINGKIYIGQTIHSINERFQRHISDAESGRLNTHLARAIRKYGKENFKIELIDKADNQTELTEKEYFWINQYQSVKNGYNETNSKNKCGGNTYKRKTPDEMSRISEKIRESKLGGRNPRATKVKCKSILTNEEKHFNSFSEMQQFFNEDNHSFITRRCSKKTKCLYKKEWLIAYEDDNYLTDYTISKGNRKSKRIKVEILDQAQEKIFESYAEAERYYKLPNKYFSSKAYKQDNPFIKGNYKITILN